VHFDGDYLCGKPVLCAGVDGCERHGAGSEAGGAGSCVQVDDSANALGVGDGRAAKTLIG
jgi:hypothetical protein